MHPLGLNLDFLFGRGYLSARSRALGEWATLESLRMEIPDLTFPFDARGGVERFRNTRCQVRNIQLAISESGLQALLSRALEEIRGFEDLRLRFGDGAARVSVRFKTLGSDTFITFKLGVVPPEPAEGDALHILFYDVRAYGPVPYPARLLVSELLDRLLTSAPLQRPGQDKLYRVQHEGDLIVLRPFKLGLLGLFPRHGWKMPSLAGIRFDTVDIHPGGLHIGARAEGEPWEPQPEARETIGSTMIGPEAAEALAAYEARDLCRGADKALWDGQLDAATETLHGLREVYGLHPALVARLLDALLASSGTGHLAEARALIDELLRTDPDNLHAHLAAPTAALLRGDQRVAVEKYELLGTQLQRRGETQDTVACLVAAAMAQRRHDPQGAAHRLQETLQHVPRHRVALEMLRDLYTELDNPERLVDILRRLSGIYTHRDRLLDLYQSLAELLMRRGDLAEARLNLEKILRLDPERLEPLFALGESYTLDQQPLQALRAFGAASRAAEERRDAAMVARLQLRIAELWAGPLDDADEALLACRRALQWVPEHRRALQMALEMAAGQGRHDEALDFIDALIPQVEREVESAAGTDNLRAALVEARDAHIRAAELAEARGRPETAASHHRRGLLYRRHAGFGAAPVDDPSIGFLDAHYRQMGRPEDLLDLYRTELDSPGLGRDRKAELHRSLAVIFDKVMGLGSEAVAQLTAALELDPDSEPAVESLRRIMTRDSRHYELRDALRDLEKRQTDRRMRGLTIRMLGELHLEALPDPEASTTQLRQALVLRPADPRAAELLVRAENVLLDIDPRADQRPLLKALERLGEIGTTPAARHGALMRAGDLCFDKLHNPLMAAGFYQRANTIRRDEHAVERLRLIRQRTGYGPADLGARPEPPVRELRFDDDEPRTLLYDVPDPEPDSDGSLELDLGLDAFRASLDQLPRQSTNLEESLSVLDKLGISKTPKRSPLRTPTGSRIPLPSEPDLGAPPPLQRSSAFDSETVVRSLEDAMNQAIQDNGARPPSVQEADTRPMPKTVRKSVHEAEEQARSLEEALVIVSQARDSGDPERLRDALEYALENEAISRDTRARFLRELGLLYYYDLEDLTTAEEHLTRAGMLDPDHTGRDFDVLTALEGIYEDLGEPESLLDIYRRKRRFARDGNMKRVYALLSAELLWERLDRPDAAAEELTGVLEEDPDNVPALRMLADIAHHQGDTPSALDHLRQIIARQSPGSFDLQDALRDTGRLLLNHIGLADEDPALLPSAEDARSEATDIYRRLLAEAPGDSAAIGTLKALLGAQGLYEEALSLLGLELSLLLGRKGDFEDGPTPNEIDPANIVPALAIPVSQILFEAADLQMTLGDPRAAGALYARAVEAWPENVDAIAARVELLRGRLEQPDEEDDLQETAESLVGCLESMTTMLLNPWDRFAALSEAALLRLSHLGDADNGEPMLSEALIVIEGLGEPPPELVPVIEAARRKLNDLQKLTRPMTALDRNSLIHAIAASLESEEADRDADDSDPQDPDPDADPAPEPEPPLDDAPPEAQAHEEESADKPEDAAEDSPEDDGPIPLLEEAPTPLVEDDSDDGPIPLLSDDSAFPVPNLEAPGGVSVEPGSNPFNLPRKDNSDWPTPDPDNASVPSGHWTQMVPTRPLIEAPESKSASDFGPPPDLNIALQDVMRSELRVDRAALIEALDRASTAALSDAESPGALRRQLLVRLAEALVGLRPQPALDASPIAYAPSQKELERALEAVGKALKFDNFEEPEAHFAKTAVLSALGRLEEALDTLDHLAAISNGWQTDALIPNGDDAFSEGLELERRIVAEAIKTLTDANAIDRKDEILDRLSTLNARVSRAVELIEDPSGGE